MSIVSDILEILEFSEPLNLDDYKNSQYAYEIGNYYDLDDNLNNSFIYNSVYIKSDDKNQSWNSIVLIIKVNKIEEVIEKINEYLISIGIEVEFTSDKYIKTQNNELLIKTINEENLDMDFIKINSGLIIQVIQK